LSLNEALFSILDTFKPFSLAWANNSLERY